jgi:hypothetical protein
MDTGVAAVLFVGGTGLRPTDGVFMLPMLFYVAIIRIPKKECVQFLSLIALLNLGWIIPTWLAFHSNGGVHEAVGYIAYIVKVKSILLSLFAPRCAVPLRISPPNRSRISGPSG